MEGDEEVYPMWNEIQLKQVQKKRRRKLILDEVDKRNGKNSI
jgi:hypothetical protein